MAWCYMKFEGGNNQGKAVMYTFHISCLPTPRQIESMVKNGYKFKIDGKIVSKGKVEQLIQDNQNKQECEFVD